MAIAVKLLIGFAIFFTGVVLNVSIMRRTEGKAKGIMPMLSFIIICAGLVVLVWMASTIRVTL
ncbi:MAG: hypothetical protein NT045_03600 [Candidatus Aureabacteria bacterium]|nr:hypothetical protein [Candidatus Auribacterota bacterium]